MKLQFFSTHDPNEKLVFPEGNVKPGDRLDYTLNYENKGEGRAFGVYISDTLDEDLDVDSLTINNGGIYNPGTRTITWFIGKLESGEQGTVSFSVQVRPDAPDKAEVINFATVYFPSVPESTRTNATVNKISTLRDDFPPTTTVIASPSANQAGWNNTDVSISLSASDNAGGSGIKELHYKLSGATEEEKTILSNIAQIAISSEGTTNLTYWAVDNAENKEPAQCLEIKIDKTPPGVNITATPENVWPPNHKLVDVRINGSATDNLSGIVSTIFVVEDEYNTIEPTISSFGDIIPLEAWREGNDKDGRVYTILVTSKDKADNETSVSTTVICPHDLGKK